MKKIKYLILLVVVLVGVSCEPTYTKTYSWAYPVAGDWMVSTYDTVTGEVTGGPYEIKSYNSSFGKDSIWIDDYGFATWSTATTPNKWIVTAGNYWTMKFKAAVNMGTKTFSTSQSYSTIPTYEIGIRVSNGKIIGNDSISFDIKFEDDATPYGSTYRVAGHREVGYDEYMQK